MKLDVLDPESVLQKIKVSAQAQVFPALYTI